MGTTDDITESGAPRIECHTSLNGFFHETLRSALATRKVDAPAPTERYLVDLLTDLGHDETVLSRSLVEIEAESQALAPEERLVCLQTLGDQALSISGLFDAHRERQGVARSYLVEVGRRAYQTASRLACVSAQKGRRACATIFFDLGMHFATYADVLDDVREATVLGTPGDVLSLYERYTKTGSPTLLSKLTERGVLAPLGGELLKA